MNMIESVRLFLPEIFLSGIALVLLGVEAARPRRLRVWSLAGSIGALVMTVWMVTGVSGQGHAFNGMVVADPFSSFFKIVALMGGILVLLLSEKEKSLMGEFAGAYAALILLSVVGTMLLVSAEDFLMVFIGLELATLPLFVLTGFARRDLRSSEGAVKFFLMGALSSGLTVYGISLIYGLCGTTSFRCIREWFLSGSAVGEIAPLFLLGLLFVLAGFAFKLTLVPFHQWVPDAYEGAPTPVTAFFSISREAGVFVVLLRFFGGFIPISEAGLTEFFIVLSILTMTVGNLTAVRQENLKRLLAYSSVAHAGTILIGVVAGNVLGRQGVMLYALAYVLMSIGAFAVVIAVSRVRGSEDIRTVRGLARDDFPLALLMLFFLISLAGIPPTLGFWGKFYVYAAAVDAGMYGLVAAGLLNAVVAVYYYFRIVQQMFFRMPESASGFAAGEIGTVPSVSREAGWGIQAVAYGSVGAILFLGIFPQSVLSWIRLAMHWIP